MCGGVRQLSEGPDCAGPRPCENHHHRQLGLRICLPGESKEQPFSRVASPYSTDNLYLLPLPRVSLQLDNGIPIATWYDDRQDRALLDLLPILKALSSAEDVRPHISSAFRLREYILNVPPVI